jgi:hypothetical protein
MRSCSLCLGRAVLIPESSASFRRCVQPTQAALRSDHRLIEELDSRRSVFAQHQRLASLGRSLIATRNRVHPHELSYAA